MSVMASCIETWKKLRPNVALKSIMPILTDGWWSADFMIAANAWARKKLTAASWRVDETYIKIRGEWTYLYHAVDRERKTLNFMLSKRSDTGTVQRFFKRAIGVKSIPDRITINKSGADSAGLQGLMLS